MLRPVAVLALLLAPTAWAAHATTAPCAWEGPEAALCAHLDRSPATYTLRFGVRLAADGVAGGEVQGDALLLHGLEAAAGPGEATGLYSVDRDATMSTVAFFVWEVDTAAHLLLP